MWNAKIMWMSKVLHGIISASKKPLPKKCKSVDSEIFDSWGSDSYVIIFFLIVIVWNLIIQIKKELLLVYD